jgi:ribosomal protein S18 acetylase RimI-like enzyme
MPLDIIPLSEHLQDNAAELFANKFKQQRQAVPALPARLEDPTLTVARLVSMIKDRRAIAAMDGGQLLGYMAWYVVENFRGAGRRGAYIPVWGHAAVQEHVPAVYAALYRAAANPWTGSGCQVHAISLLACDRDAEKTWFWNGFGLTVVDAIRWMLPLNVPVSPLLSIRKAEVKDADILAVLDEEHYQHYNAAPILMMPQAPTSAVGFREFLQQANNSVWWAQTGADAVGFMRFESQSLGASEIVQSDGTIAITGAYTRPDFRGLGAAPALLDAALRHYAAQGFERCSVDFESFNPEAAHFWMKYFDPVVFSLMRHPEAM